MRGGWREALAGALSGVPLPAVAHCAHGPGGRRRRARGRRHTVPSAQRVRTLADGHRPPGPPPEEPWQTL